MSPTFRRWGRVRRGKDDLAATIRQTITGLVDQTQLAAIRRAADAQGVLICGSHSGAFRLGRAMLARALPDMFGVGAAREKEGRATVRDPVRALYQFTRHLRAPGTLALIGADSGYAGASRPVDLGGVEAPFALGSPAAVHGARCRAVFFLVRWEGERVVLDFTAAPTPDAGVKTAEWHDIWFGAYRDHLLSIVTGDPENQRGASGLWGKLEAALRPPAEASAA